MEMYKEMATVSLANQRMKIIIIIIKKNIQKWKCIRKW